MDTKKAQKEIKKTKRKVVVVLFSIFIIGASFVYWKFFSLQGVPKGELIQEVKSPNGTYTLNAYITNGGATTSFAVRGELIFNKRKIFKTKNIYWHYKEDQANIEWQSEDTVIINGHTLHVPDETYDFRKD
ncbi:hypothetical protein BACCIP111899_00442 [Bacillus rhizoplanae]|uniref:DUF5412 domain-containing protein n=1 Tax=Bacillus rhizoplanae TaxID=2880966 RepID=A0ABM8Y6E5_9BACI|nr:DUF5412 domain-containing protein [Bacillus rhizoplanae]CAG9611270.1 hypothetical protein BACCIP111899_00442 [Bacillus rhizoplanae]